jgi:hypothetical protein
MWRTIRCGPTWVSGSSTKDPRVIVAVLFPIRSASTSVESALSLREAENSAKVIRRLWPCRSLSRRM